MKKQTEKELKIENIRLRRELAAVRRKLRNLEKDEPYALLSSDTSKRAYLFSSSENYLFFAFAALRSKSLFRRASTAFRFFSGFRILSVMLRILARIIVVLETGAHVLLVSTLLFFTLPPALFFGLATILVSSIGCKKANNELFDLPKGKDVVIFFPQAAEQLRQSSFLSGWIKERSQDDNTLILIVSPCFWRSAGYAGKRYYLHYRRDEKNVYMIRNYYYFNMKRNVLRRSPPRSIAAIY